MFRSNVRRSGSLRSTWHRRERKRRPVESPPLLGAAPTPRPPARNGPREADWLSGNPGGMLQCVARLACDHRVQFHLSPTQIERKIRLFCCGLCRLQWEAITNDEARRAVVVIENHADGSADRREWSRVRRYAVASELAATRAARRLGYPQELWEAAILAGLILSAVEARRVLRDRTVHAGTANAADEAALLRDVFGNPFAPTAVKPRWLTRTVIGLARSIYAERSFDLMGVLGDAFQDAGCDSPQVLDHCYNHGVHARGCWLLDAILGNT